MSLSEIIIEKIQKDGPVSFHDFMEMALYYPEYGYYTSGIERIGQYGDYYTSPYITPLFGYMLARQIEQMWYLLKPKQFSIVEYGAGTGLLCCDILEALKTNEEVYGSLRYHIVEKKSERKLTDEKVCWHDTINEVEPITGCVLSNELVDNFPVHLVEMQNELMEIFIDYKNGFVEELHPATDLLKQYLDELKVILPKGFRTEINLDAIGWIGKISGVLNKGFVITIDYGFSSGEMYSHKRSCGTMVCYHKHNINFSPYMHIGEQDITTHVNFSALHHWGLKQGLKLCGFTTQSCFLLSLGLCNYLREIEKKTNGTSKDNFEKAWLLQTFLMEMGQKMKVLIQNKGVGQPQLSGLQISQRLG